MNSVLPLVIHLSTIVIGCLSVDRYYTEEHLWVKLRDQNKTVVISITERGANLIGDIFGVTLPEVGQIVYQGEYLLSVEGDNFSYDFHSPLSGEISKINTDLFLDPSLLNRFPWSYGWLVRMQTFDLDGELPSLMTTEEHNQLIREKLHIIN
ncbi:glycine cleavage system H protein-like isoform X1 [Convolutriloba macropyga]|uniref:glycine cleavage system H protein-like isoform X1 n=1 Tax=Convolutriloba macropyga TaxID=536237 RepID=UPI003F52433D